jgi:hypothetical protein
VLDLTTTINVSSGILESVEDLSRLRTTKLWALILTFVALSFLQYSCYYLNIMNLVSMCLYFLHCFVQSQNYNCMQ